VSTRDFPESLRLSQEVPHVGNQLEDDAGLVPAPHRSAPGNGVQRRRQTLPADSAGLRRWWWRGGQLAEVAGTWKAMRVEGIQLPVQVNLFGTNDIITEATLGMGDNRTL
jgi:hypothetical protein